MWMVRCSRTNCPIFQNLPFFLVYYWFFFKTISASFRQNYDFYPQSTMTTRNNCYRKTGNFTSQDWSIFLTTKKINTVKLVLRSFHSVSEISAAHSRPFFLCAESSLVWVSRDTRAGQNPSRRTPRAGIKTFSRFERTVYTIIYTCEIGN